MTKLEFSDSDMSVLGHAMMLAQERLIGFSQNINAQIAAQQPQSPQLPDNKTNGADAGTDAHS